MGKCCVFCYRNCQEDRSFLVNEVTPDHINLKGKLLKRFFKLLQRHFENGRGSKDAGKFNLLINKLIDNEQMSGCEDCLKVVDSFCNCFHQMQLMELTVNFKLWTLSNIMRSAEKAPSGEENLSEIFNEVGSNDVVLMHLLKQIKEEILKQCSGILSDSFPKVSLQKYLISCNLGGERRSVNKSNSVGDGLALKNEKTFEDNVCDKNIKTEKLITSSFLAGGDTENPENDDDDDYFAFSDAEETPTVEFVRNTEKVNENEIEDQETNKIANNDANNGNISINGSLKLTDSSRKRKCDSDIRGKDDSRPNKRSLRKMQQCSDCNKTFSTNESFLNHLQQNECVKKAVWNDEDGEGVDIFEGAKGNPKQGHQGTAQIEMGENDSENDNPDDEEYFSGADASEDESGEDEEGDFSSSSSSSEEESVDDDRADNNEDCSTSITVKKPKKGKRVKINDFFRIKCPQCGQYFLKVEQLLLHYRKCDKSRKNECIPENSSTIKVDIIKFNVKGKHLSPYETSKINSGSKLMKKCAELFATVELPTFVELCEVESCKLPFFCLEDLQNHKKLHGTFSCQFCSTVETYAPNLSVHEAEAHTAVAHKKTKLNLRKPWECPRCDPVYLLSTKSNYISHHLFSHLSLTYGVSVCAICGSDLKHSSLSHIAQHYKMFHDIRNPDNNTEIVRCPVEGCLSYFRTANQLTKHQKRKHKLKIKTSKIFQCKDCGAQRDSHCLLRLHRIQKHVKSEDLLACTHPKCQTKFETEKQRSRHKHFHMTDKKIQQKCPKCSQLFHGKLSLQRHLKSHSNLPSTEIKKEKKKALRTRYVPCRFQCDCGKLFDKLSGLILHRREDEGKCQLPVGLEQIKVAIVRINKKEPSVPLDEYAVIDVPNKFFFCSDEDCKDSFYSEEDLNLHKKLHNQFKCSFCNFEMKYAPDLANHELICRLKKIASTSKTLSKSKTNRTCSRCDFQLTGLRREFIGHFIKEHLSLDFPLTSELRCPICYYQIDKGSKRYFMNNHLKVNHNINIKASANAKLNVKKCYVSNCPAYFVKRWQLISHLKNDHVLTEEQIKRKSLPHSDHKCTICYKAFGSKPSLIKHQIKIHNVPESSFLKCSFEKCSVLFMTEKELKSHETRLHSKNEISKEVMCPKCGKIFPWGANHGSYKGHLKFHEREGLPKMKSLIQYVCDQCGKIFKAKEHYQRHLLHHSGPNSWQFVCSICSKKCATKGALASHMQIHSQEKPFVCQVCGVKYAHRHNLRIHVNSKHSDVMQDIPRKRDTTNMASTRKGKKLK